MNLKREQAHGKTHAETEKQEMDCLMVEALFPSPCHQEIKRVPCEFFRVQEKSRCGMQLCRGRRHAGLGGEIRDKKLMHML
jgi:hypothetical protein